MTTLEKLEWALMTIREQLKFGMEEDQAIKRREDRVRGVLIDAVEEVAEMEKELANLASARDELSAALKQKDEVIRVLKETMEFYGSQKSWGESSCDPISRTQRLIHFKDTENFGELNPVTLENILVCVGGKRAREALTKISAINNGGGNVAGE